MKNNRPLCRGFVVYCRQRASERISFLGKRKASLLTFACMPFNFITAIEILGTFSFAVSGAFAAMEKRLDPLGVLIISFVTAIGGGTIRDILLGDLPVAWLSDNTTAWVIAISAVVAIFFGSLLKKLDKLLFLFDAIGLGLFTMIGLQKGIQHGLSTGICIALGTITGCFGGVLRDVLLNKVPLIFQKEIYASACIAGGLLFFVMRKLQMAENPNYIAGIVTVFVIRLLAVRFNWSLPLFYLRRGSKKSKLKSQKMPDRPY